MTRTAAREIAVQICFNMTFDKTSAPEAVSAFFEEEYYKTLSDVDDLFLSVPDEKQRSYILCLTKGVQDHRQELDEYIGKYSKAWKINRISKIAASILRICMYEVLYMGDIPDSVAINEAVELSKGYEESETVSFINGILGSFYRGEIRNEQS